MICPKCNYKRRSIDNLSTPDYQCPKCGIVYKKYKKPVPVELGEDDKEEKKTTRLKSGPTLKQIAEGKNKAKENEKPLTEEEQAFRDESKKKLINLAQLAGVAVFSYFAISYQADHYTPEKTKPSGELEALFLCQQTLINFSRDPEKADIPYVPNMSSSSTEFYYAWGGSTKYARMRNGLGLEVPVSASCVVNSSTNRITSLSIDGETKI